VHIVFSHANSFPASTYSALFENLLARGMTVTAIEKFGHHPDYPVTDSWPHLVRQLADFAAAEVKRIGEPVFFVGHSLGGYLSLMTAAHHPHLARGVLLIDSPVLSGWLAATLSVIKRAKLVGTVTPGKVSRLRRTSWASEEAALEHFRSKKAFARWDAQVLQDYIRHATHDAEGKRLLSFDRDVETAIYNALPHNIDGLLKRHPLRCPAAFIGGLQSEELRQVGMTMTRKLTQGRITMLDGSHLFPMEKPVATAAAIEAALRAL